MKYMNVWKIKHRRPMNLQMFAEDPADGAEENSTPEEEPKEEKSEEPEKKYTDKDVDKIVAKKFGKWQAEKEKELADAKAEAEKLAKMNAQQKSDYEIEKLKAENEKLKAEQAHIALCKEAGAIFKEHKIDATQDILDLVVAKDAETTKANIDKLVEFVQAQLKAADVERATGSTPKKYTNNGQTLDAFDRKLEKYK